MPDAMEWASGWFAGMREQYASRRVTYVWPGLAEAELEHATLLPPTSELTDTGITVSAEATTWILRTAELMFQVDLRYPEPGDQIRAVIDEQEVVFTVASPGQGVPCWEWFDPYRRQIKVHTKATEWPSYLSTPR